MIRRSGDYDVVCIVPLAKISYVAMRQQALEALQHLACRWQHIRQTPGSNALDRFSVRMMIVARKQAGMSGPGATIVAVIAPGMVAHRIEFASSLPERA